MKLSHFIIAFGVTVAACAVSAANLRMAAGSRAHEVPETQSESCGSVMPQCQNVPRAQQRCAVFLREI